MDKTEIIKIKYEFLLNKKLPDNLSEEEKKEIMNALVEYDNNLINKMPIYFIKEKIIEEPSFLRDISFKKLSEIFSDKNFTDTLFEKDNFFMFYFDLEMLDFKCEYLEKVEKEYLMGIRKIRSNTLLHEFFEYCINAVREDYDICMNVVSRDIDAFSFVENETVKKDNNLLYKFLEKNPDAAQNYKERLNMIIDDNLFEILLKSNLENKSLITNKKYLNLIDEKYARFNKEFNNYSMNNKNLRYDFIFNDLLFEKYKTVIESMLRYDTDLVDYFVSCLNDTNILKYIDFYFENFGESCENVQYAIRSYDKVKDIYDEILKSNDNSYNSKFKETIQRNNSFGIQNFSQLEDFDNIKKNYFMTKMSDPDNRIEDIYFEYIINSNEEEAKKFYKGYLGNDINSFINYCKENGTDFEYLKEIFSKDINREKLKDLILNNYKFYDLDEIKEQIRKFYSKKYDSKLLNLDNLKSEKNEQNGINVINLYDQDFNILIHRIYNFNFDLNNLTQELLNNPSSWNKLEGATTISTSLISNSKISGVFEILSDGEDKHAVVNPETEEEEAYRRNQEILDINYGKKIRKIADSSVFYGFTELDDTSILDMSNIDNMVEHGIGKFDINTSRSMMLNERDLAYWTNYTYWNEVTLKRYKDGNERLQPTCIVCFDNNINENSIRAAKTFNIPIVNIDRKKYAIREEQKLKDEIDTFCRNYDQNLIEEIFYTLSYEKLVNFIPLLINRLNTENNLTDDRKKVLLNIVKEESLYFLNKSICTSFSEELDKKMIKFIEQIDSIMDEYENKKALT